MSFNEETLRSLKVGDVLQGPSWLPPVADEEHTTMAVTAIGPDEKGHDSIDFSLEFHGVFMGRAIASFTDKGVKWETFDE